MEAEWRKVEHWQGNLDRNDRLSLSFWDRQLAPFFQLADGAGCRTQNESGKGRGFDHYDQLRERERERGEFFCVDRQLRERERERLLHCSTDGEREGTDR